MDEKIEKKSLIDAIADFSAKKSGKRSQQNASLQKAQPKSTPPKSFDEDPELEQMLGRIRFIQGDLRQRFEKIARELGVTVEQLEEYVGNQANFPKEFWEKTQRETRELEQKLTQAGLDPKKMRKNDVEVAQDAKKRRKSTLGSRKKWLPM